MSKVVFLDTNVYLHYQLFDQINWLDVLKTDAVTIVVPPVTVRELNKLKDSHSRARVRRRAGKVLKRWFKLFASDYEASLRDDVDVRLEDRDPMIDFESYQLSRAVQDDEFIASMIMYRDEIHDAEIVLVTSDAGLALRAKAKRQGIPVINLPDNYRLPEEPDPEQNRIRELEQELRELELRTPELSLIFQEGGQRVEFALSPPVELTQEELESSLGQIKQRYPKMEKQRRRATESHGTMERLANLTAGLAAAAAAADVWNIVSPEAIANYNARLEKFYEAWTAHLQRVTQHKNLRRRTVKLAILLANDGTAPGEDMDVGMHFPDGFSLRSEQAYPEPPEPPKPPSKPKTRMQQMLDSSDRMTEMYIPALGRRAILTDSILPPPNVSGPNIERTGSYDVRLHVQRVKHRVPESFEPLYVVFESFENARSFNIEYAILAANVPHEINGKLHVIIQKLKE